MSAKDYLDFLVREFSPVSISTGFNHTFGQNKSGNAEFLSDYQDLYGYKYLCSEPVKYNGNIISSTYIKQLLKTGHIEEANMLLGSNFFVEGIVIKGAQIGQTIGFPTANIHYPEDIVQIPYGVYIGKSANHKIVLNWGLKPTVNNTKQPVLEAHFINFTDNLYGKKIKIELIKKIRDERKFSSIEELKEQIRKDITVCSEL